MSTTAQSIFDKAAFLLNDVGNVRWTPAELLGWITDAQREAVVLKPDLNSVTTVLTLTEGTRQQLSALSDLNLLLRVSRNMAADGVTPGRVIRVTSSDILDNWNPDWHSDTPSVPVVHYTYDPRTYDVFFVYPATVDGTKVEAIYSATPAPITDAGQNVALPDIYATALVDYICYRALSKDAEFGDISEKAAAHYKLFTDAIANSHKQRLEESPNLEQAQFNPINPPAAK